MGSYMRGGGHAQPSHRAAHAPGLEPPMPPNASGLCAPGPGPHWAPTGPTRPRSAPTKADEPAIDSPGFARARYACLTSYRPGCQTRRASAAGSDAKARAKKNMGVARVSSARTPMPGGVGLGSADAERDVAAPKDIANGAVGRGGTQPLVGGFASCNFQSRAAVFVLASSPVDGRRAARELIHHGGRPRQSA